MENNDETTESRVLAIVSRVFNKPLKDLDFSLRIDDLAEDSIAMFSLITAFEEAFHLEANYIDLINIETLGDIVTYLKKSQIKH
ncbi:MAG: phosphopantetheine-binding protein [Candidatus Moranbacteria bacterium]|nr:phosphopantetheine-binding protein [Candidatus Moranbacteria bacterium]MDD3965021.1 phosphopantetheine-binding protein [Candidatus Moranbacteria bacterium]